MIVEVFQVALCACMMTTLVVITGFADDDTLHASLWSEECVGAVLYCLRHDPSIRVRRAAMSLMSSVALPAQSPSASHMMEVLAMKARDKDPTVLAAAMELIVQLPASTVVSNLTAVQWVGVVQAGLHLLAAGGEPMAASTRGSMDGKDIETGRGTSNRKSSGCVTWSQFGKGLFLDMLRHVLMSQEEDGQPLTPVTSCSHIVQSNGRPAGVTGCKHILMCLLAEPNNECMISKVLEELSNMADQSKSDADNEMGWRND